MALPAEVVLFKDLEEIKKEILRITEPAVGKMIALPNVNQPLWYYFLLFKSLRRHASEIILQLNPTRYLLLYTSHRNEYARPASVAVFSQLLEVPSEYVNTDGVTEKFHLDTLKYTDEKSLKDIITTVKSKLHPTGDLIFIGETDCVSGLIALVIWMGYAKNIVYNVNNIEVTI